MSDPSASLLLVRAILQAKNSALRQEIVAHVAADIHQMTISMGATLYSLVFPTRPKIHNWEESIRTCVHLGYLSATKPPASTYYVCTLTPRGYALWYIIHFRLPPYMRRVCDSLIKPEATRYALIDEKVLECRNNSSTQS